MNGTRLLAAVRRRWFQQDGLVRRHVEATAVRELAKTRLAQEVANALVAAQSNIDHRSLMAVFFSIRWTSAWPWRHPLAI
jgi:hypothetical protein